MSFFPIYKVKVPLKHWRSQEELWTTLLAVFIIRASCLRTWHRGGRSTWKEEGRAESWDEILRTGRMLIHETRLLLGFRVLILQISFCVRYSLWNVCRAPGAPGTFFFTLHIFSKTSFVLSHESRNGKLDY